MVESLGKFRKRSDENLLQLWRGRDALKDEEIDPLRTELEQRGLSAQLAALDEQAPGKNIYGNLPPPPQSFLNLSVPALWLREKWLRHRTRGGVLVEARIEMVQRTRSRIGRAARATLTYSYEVQGQQYCGRVIRDFAFDSASADSLVYDHHVGERLSILVNPEAPEVSYYPSGLGLFDPIILGIQSMFAWGIVVGLIRLCVLSILRTP